MLTQADAGPSPVKRALTGLALGLALGIAVALLVPRERPPSAAEPPPTA